jgi:hypothetical protein
MDLKEERQAVAATLARLDVIITCHASEISDRNKESFETVQHRLTNMVSKKYIDILNRLNRPSVGTEKDGGSTKDLYQDL